MNTNAFVIQQPIKVEIIGDEVTPYVLNVDPGNPGGSGQDGREIELQATSTHIQWRYVGDASWINLVALSAITGPQGAPGTNGTNGTNGKSVELQATATYIQWRLVGDSTWINLVALSAITGPAGGGGVDYFNYSYSGGV